MVYSGFLLERLLQKHTFLALCVKLTERRGDPEKMMQYTGRRK